MELVPKARNISGLEHSRDGSHVNLQAICGQVYAEGTIYYSFVNPNFVLPAVMKDLCTSGRYALLQNVNQQLRSSGSIQLFQERDQAVYSFPREIRLLLGSFFLQQLLLFHLARPIPEREIKS